MHVTLADGRGVVVRELQPDDAPALVGALETSTPDDLYRRYLGCAPPASFLVKRLQTADRVHHAYVGAFAPDGTLVGSAQFDRSDDAPTAEIAVQVAPEWQHDGLGTALMQRLAELARQQGVCTFTATYLANNIPIRRLLRDTGRLVSSDCADGEGHAVLDLLGA